jgi:hypothetical protein
MQTRSPFRKLFAPVLGSLLLLSGSLPALAQDDSSNPGPSPTPGNSVPQEPQGPQGPGANRAQHLNPNKMKKRWLMHLEKVAQITTDQQTKITPIISNFVDQIVAVRSNSSLQPEEKKARQKELRKQYSHQIKPLLTQQQIQALRNSAQAAKHQNKGPSQNSNSEDEQFEQGSNQPGPGGI